MGITATPIPEGFDVRYLNGPWRNDACCGYMILAMEQMGFLRADIKKALGAIEDCFDDTSVEEAANYWTKW